VSIRSKSLAWPLWLLITALPAAAHHSFAMFDQTRTVVLKGVVTEMQWTNPHAFLHVRVGDSDATIWQVELNSPNNLRRQGWKSNSIKAGERVTVTINPLRDGTHGGLFVSVTLPDGSVLGEPAGNGGPINVPKVD
jgi:hypothetical protein